MTPLVPIRSDIEVLLGEAGRYLAAIDAFRAEGCEPSWRPERTGEVRTPKRSRRHTDGEPSIP